MTARDDFRALAHFDVHARELQDLSDEWFDRSGLTVSSLPGAAVACKTQTCPVDPLATAMLKYWAVEPGRDEETHLVQITLLALAFGSSIGAERMWGFIKGGPTGHAQHLIEFLDQVVANGACERVIGEEMDEGDFSMGVFYIADIDKARRWMHGR